jgi:hypothetical protein
VDGAADPHRTHGVPFRRLEQPEARCNHGPTILD